MRESTVHKSWDNLENVAGDEACVRRKRHNKHSLYNKWSSLKVPLSSKILVLSSERKQRQQIKVFKIRICEQQNNSRIEKLRNENRLVNLSDYLGFVIKLDELICLNHDLSYDPVHGRDHDR